MKSSKGRFDAPVFKKNKYIKIYAGVFLQAIKDLLASNSNKFGQQKELQKAYRKVSEAVSIIDSIETGEKDE